MTPPAMAATGVWLDDRSDAACADAVGARGVPVLAVEASVPVPVLLLVVCALPLDVVVGTSSNLVRQMVRTQHAS